MQIPEGAVRFELQPDEIAEVISEASGEIAAAEDIPGPAALLPQDELQALLDQQRPAYVALDGSQEARHGLVWRAWRITCSM